MTQIMACQMRQRGAGTLLQQAWLTEQAGKRNVPLGSLGVWGLWLRLQLQTCAFTLRLYGSQALLGWAGA